MGQRKEFRVECWCRSYESSLPEGIEAVLKYGDATGFVVAANAALERGDHHNAERIRDCYVRKTPQNERDAEWISAIEGSIARLKSQRSEVQGAPEEPFRWEELDQRILRHKIDEIVSDMQQRATAGERRITFETAESGNSAGYLPRYFEFHENLADEWAENLYAAHCDTWKEQNREVSPPFIRAVRDQAIAVLMAARKSSVCSQIALRGVQINEPPNPIAVGEFRRRMDRLAVRWFNRLEAEAAAAEYKAAEMVTPMSSQVPEQQTDSNNTAEVWSALYELFDDLAEEELKAEPQNRNDRWMRAHVSYDDPNVKWGDWSISRGVSEKFKARFEVTATRAGIALSGVAAESQPLHLWLHHVYQHLLEEKSSLLFAATNEGGIINRICEASAIFCSRLEIKGLTPTTRIKPLARFPASETGGSGQQRAKTYPENLSQPSVKQSTPHPSRVQAATKKGGAAPASSPECNWQDIEVVFLSDERVQIYRKKKASETLNFAEFGFCNQKTEGPNKAWTALLHLALGKGIVRNPAEAGVAWDKFEKRVQEIRRALRGHFKIEADPIVFVEDLGYRTQFTIRCGASFRR